ncbi:MAG: hypothetical protein IKY33_00515, partial [Clostridia bacterium]|nr:hypothetical protein [Clostridia bacterium]
KVKNKTISVYFFGRLVRFIRFFSVACTFLLVFWCGLYAFVRFFYVAVLQVYAAVLLVSTWIARMCHAFVTLVSRHRKEEKRIEESRRECERRKSPMPPFLKDVRLVRFRML